MDEPCAEKLGGVDAPAVRPRAEEVASSDPERLAEETPIPSALLAATLVRPGIARDVSPGAEPVRVLARVVAPGGLRVALESAEWFTPYTAETIAEHALRAGPGARLEVTVASEVADIELRLVQRRFASLIARGVEVNVHRDRRGTASPRNRQAAA